MTAWHVYGILGQQPREVTLEGLHGAPVRVLGGPDVWALASEVQALPSNALDPIMHHKVIEAALEQWDVLPARFMAPVEHRLLLNRLEANSQKHLLALARIRGSLEFGVRAQFDSGFTMVQDKRAYKTEDIAQELEKALPALEWLHRFPEPGVYRGSVLVPKATLLNFRMAFMKLEFAPTPSLHGPFPAYSFASIGTFA